MQEVDLPSCPAQACVLGLNISQELALAVCKEASSCQLSS